MNEKPIKPNESSITPELKKQILDAINNKYYFDKLGNVYCRECKNETIACICMGDNENE